MGNMSVDGIVSGMNTSEIIRQLMQLERQPQVRLQSARSAAQAAADAYRSLATKFSAVLDAAKTLTGPGGWGAAAATSSAPDAVGVSAQPTAATATLSFTVEQLATAGSAVSSGSVADPADTVTSLGAIRVTKGATSTTVTITDGSLAGVAAAINAADLGVRATVVQVAAGAYRLQLSSTTTGAGTDVSVDDGSGGNPFASSTLGTLTTMTTGQDAQLRIGGAAGYTVTRPSNTISDLLPGVTLTLRAADPAATVTVEVSTDPGVLADRVAKLVDALNAAAAEVKKQTANPPGGNPAPLARDLLPHTLLDGLARAVSDPVAGNAIGSAGLAGVELTRDGGFTFDRQAFLDRYRADPTAVVGLLGDTGVAGRIQTAADAAVTTGTGRIPTMVSSYESRLRELDQRIDDWDDRLARREAVLRRQFSALETALGRMRQQSDWLAGQLAGLFAQG